MNKYDLKIAFTYVGAIVGAGFASGQELVRFFVVFQQYGLWGTLTAGLLFSLLGALVLRLINRIKVKDYGELFRHIFPRYIYRIIELIISLSLWLGVGIMLIGSSTLLKEQFNISIIYGFIFTALLVFSCLFVGSQGLLNANTILVPILIIFAVGSSIIYIFKPAVCMVEYISVNTLLPNWWMASLLYAAYNMVLGIVVLASLEETDKEKTFWGGIVGGVLLAMMAWIMVKGLILLPKNLLIAEMPMVLLARQIHPFIEKLYTVALLIALFTTALANAHSLTTRLSNKNKNNYRKILALIIISTILFIPWKFSVLVGSVYPILGYLGVPVIMGLIIASFK